MKTKTNLIPRSAILGALLFSGALTVAAFAQNATPNASSNNMNASKLDWGDKRFLTKAEKAGMEEVAISRVAAERATNPEVKAFAQKIVADHESLNKDLTSLANTEGVTLSSSMEKHDDKLTSKWEKKEAGADFDKAYLKQMASDHEDALELFGKASKSKNPEIASVASKALPTLQEHHTRAMELRKTLGE